MFNFITRKNKVDFYKFYSDFVRGLVVVPIALSKPVTKKFLNSSDNIKSMCNHIKIIDTTNHIAFKQSVDEKKNYHNRDDYTKSLIICIVIKANGFNPFSMSNHEFLIAIPEKEFRQKKFEEVIKFTDYENTPITEEILLNID